MSSSLEKIIKMSQNTGERVVVFNEQNPEKSFVVLNLKDYEKLNQNLNFRGLTEEELLDRINRDIATWKSENQSQKTPAEILGRRFYCDFEGPVPFCDIGEDDFSDDWNDFEDEDDWFEDDEEEDFEIPEPYYYEHAGEEFARPTHLNDNFKVESDDYPDLEEPEDESEVREEENQRRDFDSIGEELERRRGSWKIPREVKERAEDMEE